MNIEYFRAMLSNNLEAIHGLMRGVSADQACWKPETIDHFLTIDH